MHTEASYSSLVTLGGLVESDAAITISCMKNDNI